MKQSTKRLIGVSAVLVFLIMLSLIFSSDAKAHDITINNYYVVETPEPAPQPAPPPSNLTITEEMDEEAMSRALSVAIPAGAHQFDYTTTRYQMSLTGAWQFGGEDDSGYSVGMGKRFGQDSFLPNALFHGSYTPDGDDDWLQLGVTIVF